MQIGTAAREIEPIGLGVDDAARAVGVSRATLYPLLSSGEIPSRLVGGRRIVSVDGLRRWLDNRGTEDGQTYAMELRLIELEQGRKQGAKATAKKSKGQR